MDHALRMAGGAGGVEHRGGLVRRQPRDLLLEQARMRLQVVVAARDQGLERQQRRLPVVAQAARVVEDDSLQQRMRLRHLQHLVGLLLVLDQGEGDLGVLEHVDQFVGDRILVERHRYPADRLGRDHCRVKPRPVLADQRQMLAAAEALGEQSRGDRLDFVAKLAPAGCLPDAEVLLAQCRGIGSRRRMHEEQPGKRGTAFCQVDGGCSFRHVSVACPDLSQRRPPLHLAAVGRTSAGRPSG